MPPLHVAVVKCAGWESRRSRVQTPLWLSSVKETKCFFPAHSQRLNIVGNLRDQEVACSASERKVRISTPVSAGQCHLTILRRFSWPSLAYM